MPINSNGSNLKVQTVVGDKIYKDEETYKVFYDRNQQTRTRPKKSTETKPFGRNRAEDYQIDPAMEAAINDDLNKRGVRRRKPPTQPPKTTNDYDF